MIQRIQTIFLLLVCIAMALASFSPLLIINTPLLEGPDSNLVILNSFGICDGVSIIKYTWGVVSFAIISALLAFINIFLYKNRKRQIKIGDFTTLLIILYYITFGVYFYFLTIDYGVVVSNIQYGIILPFVALIFNILAVYRIKKDEKLVRSMNRIR